MGCRSGILRHAHTHRFITTLPTHDDNWQTWWSAHCSVDDRFSGPGRGLQQGRAGQDGIGRTSLASSAASWETLFSLCVCEWRARRVVHRHERLDERLRNGHSCVRLRVSWRGLVAPRIFWVPRGGGGTERGGRYTIRVGAREGCDLFVHSRLVHRRRGWISAFHAGGWKGSHPPRV